MTHGRYLTNVMLPQATVVLGYGCAANTRCLVLTTTSAVGLCAKQLLLYMGTGLLVRCS